MFRQKSPGTIIVLLFFGLLLKLPVFLYPKKITVSQNDEDFYRWMLEYINSITTSNAFFCACITFFLLYIQALMVNHLVNEYRLLLKPTYLPAMAYLLLTSLLPEWNYLSSPLMATTFILWILIKLLNLYNNANVKGQIYNIGLLLGISSYFYFPSASFLFCIILGLIILRPFRLNEVVLLLMGALTPYYFIAAYLFLKDQLSFESFFPHVSFNLPEIKGTVWLALAILLLTLPFLIGGFFVQAHLHKMLIQVRKSWSILLLFLVLAFFVPFVNSNSSFSNWILLAVPFACFHASMYHFASKKWLLNIVLFLTTGYVVYLQYFTRLWH